MTPPGAPSFAAIAALLPIALAACGGSHVPAFDAGGEPDVAVSPCAYIDTIDRTCATDADCLVRLHQTDCCGSSVMIGIATSALAAYNASEPACMASYPACGCPAMLPLTDSGETVTDTSAVLAACVSRGPRNVCLTYVTVRPLPGR